MQASELREYLENAPTASEWLRGMGIVDTQRAHGNLLRLQTYGLPLDLLSDICAQLGEQLPRISDADMALNNLERFFEAARNPLALGALFERDRAALPILLQIFSTSQYLSDALVADPSSYDLLRITEGEPVARRTLMDEIESEIAAITDLKLVMAALRRYKKRETLRISYGDLIRGQRLEIVAAQISYLADALVHSAVAAARRNLEAKRGVPRTPAGEPARFVVLGMGKLGGVELNYSSDIDLIFLYDYDGQTDGQRSQTNAEFFDRVARDVVKLLSESTELGSVYRVDLRLRPAGERGPMVTSLESAMQYYDVLGRTWERQAFVKARAAAGDLDLGEEFLQQLEPWIYRRYLSRADITGIKALKRRIDQRTQSEGSDDRHVKTGHGGIRDIEFVIQFLQLLNGGDQPEVRTTNTLQAIAALERVGCLTQQERSLLEESYDFLRNVEHRLQIMFDLQTHLLPDSSDEMRKLAIRMGYADTPEGSALAAFESDYRRITSNNRKILDHLLQAAFADDEKTEPVVDLVLDPDPPAERIDQVMSGYRFQDTRAAYDNLQALATESIRFLSTRRCRHFLAAIAPQLLEAIAATPDPDSTLVDLARVSDSLGGKGVLWELFSFHRPSLRLYVELCASSPFLSGILISNPGMIDELMDSLVLDKLPELDPLRATISDLCHAAEDIDPILHSFKHTQQLRVGVREILGKEDIRATTGALSDIAQVCLEQITAAEQEKLLTRLGTPTIAEGPRAGEPCELVIVAMGKFGGAELNYRSDLDLIFLYEADGQTQPGQRSRQFEQTSNRHFYSELGQRIIKVSNRLGPYGRLYEIDPRLRPTGRSGALATSLAEFARYFSSGEGQLWERQALCRARVVVGSPRVAEVAWQAIAEAAYGPPWRAEDAESIREMRGRLEAASKPHNLKRGTGGLVDIEFLAQMLQMRHAGDDASLRKPNTLTALEALGGAGRLSREDVTFFSESYRFLRVMEARLQLMNTGASGELPDDPIERDKLARLLGYAETSEFVSTFERYTRENRARFNRLFDAATRA